MEENKQPKAAVWAIAVAIATSIITYWQYEAKLSSPRPVFQGSKEVSSVGEQKALARLWQDPFVDFRTNTTEEVSKLAHQIEEKQRGKKNVRILAVMVEGFPYPEDVEERLRSRYAVEAAVFASDYKLSDRSHLGLVEIDWPDTDSIDLPEVTDDNEALESNQALPAWAVLIEMLNSPFRPPMRSSEKRCHRLTIPFEWAENNSEMALILWLPEEQFADLPLSRIAMLMKRLGQKQFQENRIAFDLIGPRSSDTLKNILRDPAFSGEGLSKLPRERHALLTNSLHILSTSATAPDSTLVDEPLTKSEAPRAYLTKKFRDALGPNSFSNFIATDDALAVQIIEELNRRNVKLEDQTSSALVLISESDTSYGRTLPECFRAVVNRVQEESDFARGNTRRRLNGLPTFASGPGATGKWPKNMQVFSYLRGLDGFVTRTSAGKENQNPPKKEDESAQSRLKEAEETEPAQGESQFDYLRRLAGKIENWRDELFEYKCSYSPRLAIGVLGSDTYDKLILLQALKGRFKDAIFFATDLDARYMSKEQLQFCRNLLIVSAEGLDPMLKHAARAIPPFREGYQTAMFNACCSALGNPQPRSTEPVIFEVGLKHALNLREPSRSHINPHSTRFFLSMGSIILGLVGTALLMPSWAKAALRVINRALGQAPSDKRSRLLLFEDTHFDENENEWLLLHLGVQRRQALWTIVWSTLGCATFITCLVIFWLDNFAGDGEPFEWLNGVSIWPTELMRIGIVFVGILSLLRAWHIFKLHKIKLWRQFFGPDTGLPLTLTDNEIAKPGQLAQRLLERTQPLEQFIRDRFCPDDLRRLRTSPALSEEELKLLLARNLNRIIAESDGIELPRIDDAVLANDTKRLLKMKPEAQQCLRVSRLLLRDYFKEELVCVAPAAPQMPAVPTIPDGKRKRSSGLLRWIMKCGLPALSVSLWCDHQDFINARKCCLRYFQLGSLLPRVIRIALGVSAYTVFGFGLFVFWGFPSVPGRGDASFWWDKLILVTVVAIFIILVFYVVDATRLTSRFITHLGDGVTIWPDHVQREVALKRNLDPAHISGWLDVQFVAFHTEEVGRLFYLPFLLLTLLLVSRNELFAPWTWPYCLLAINVTSAMLVFLSAFHVRRCAQRVRTQAIDSLREVQIRLQGSEGTEHAWIVRLDARESTKACRASNYSEKIKQIIEELEQIKLGAFSKVLRDDSVTAALLPAVGAVLLIIVRKLFLQ